LVQTVKIFIRENPELTLLLVFIVLVLDALYVYRMFKKVWKKSSYRPLSVQPSDNKPAKSK